MKNPYDWTGDHPDPYVPREKLLTLVLDRIEKGQSGYLIGCRGMGKSAFRRRLVSELWGKSHLHVAVFDTARASADMVKRALQAIADRLTELLEPYIPTEDLEPLKKKMSRCAEREDLPEVFSIYFNEKPKEIERVVLLYDELDTYADPPELGRRLFNDLEAVRKESNGQIVIHGAGGLGIAALDSLYGSSFFSRMTPEILEPFSREELQMLAMPFEERGTPLELEVLETLRLTTGGNPALATYGLQHMWTCTDPSPLGVSDIFNDFRNKMGGNFIDKILKPIFGMKKTRSPKLVWQELKRAGGTLTRKRIREIIKSADDEVNVKAEWIFRMLRSTGLIRPVNDNEPSPGADMEIIHSILMLDVEEDESIDSCKDIRSRFIRDIKAVLSGIQRSSPDFFLAKKDKDKEIAPEAIFSAVINTSLPLIGWRVEREAQSASGRTDIKARHVDFGEQAILVEVKIWNRNAYEDIHNQVVSYWSDGVEALATIMISDIKDEEWADTYRSKCLDEKQLTHERKNPPSHIAGHFVAKTKGCHVAEVDHFLLRLGKR